MSLGLGEGGEQNAPLGPRGDRRPDVCHRRDAVLCAGIFQLRAWPARQNKHPAGECKHDVHGWPPTMTWTRMKRQLMIGRDEKRPQPGAGSIRLSRRRADPGAVVLDRRVGARRSSPDRGGWHRAAGEGARCAAKRNVDVAVPTVSVAHPKRGAPQPGNHASGEHAGVYRLADLCPHQRLSEKWYVDIGAHVKSGQLLAEIETPEVDQQLSKRAPT